MSDIEDQEARLLQQAVDACKQEHEELSEQWNALDTKAQGTMATAGIFVAGMLAFINTLSQTATAAQKWFLTGAAVLLALCIVVALRVLAVREVTSAPVGAQLRKLVDDLLGVPGAITPSRLQNFARDHMRMWEAANKDVRDVNASKAKQLACAQWILFAAILCAAVVTLLKTWG